MTVHKDENGFVWYINFLDVTGLPDMFATEVREWLNLDIDPWEKDGGADSMYYPLQAENVEQLNERKDMLENGIGVIDGVRTHGRRSLHTDE